MTQRAASKPAHITQRQADRAVARYLRSKPYTAIGIKRVPCLRCGAPSEQQWNICSLPGYHGICTPCDVALNAMVLEFMGLPDAGTRAAEYAERIAA
ncbi:hypothetical protein [Sphingomonas sp. PB4P5]|uniref:hypothetical protein n=1 Tax=Parasphingomonas puruogangriensis TaxID=3096155 RepID=UPI002FC58741